jgi:TRAP transporter TAXI family solute receptor
MRRIWLGVVAGSFALAAVVAFALYQYSRPTTLKVAVGPPKGEDARLMSAIAGQLGRERAEVRLRIIEKQGPQEAAAALDKGEVDLAVVRRDLAMSATGQAVMVLRTSMIAILPLPGSTARKVGDLAGQRIGVVGRGRENVHVLEAILRHYGVDPNGLQVVPVEPDEVSQTVSERKVDVLFLAAPLESKEMTDAVMTIWHEGRAPTFVPISEAEALAQRLPVYEAGETLAGAFGGNPPQPPKSVATIAFSHYLVAASTVSEGTIGELAKLLLNVRPRISGAFATANHIKAPDTDKDSAVRVHPGAAAYFDGEQKTFLERYSDFFYLGVMFASILASAAAAIAGYGRASDRNTDHRVVVRNALDLMARAHGAEDVAQLEGLQREHDALLIRTLDQFAAGKIDEGSMRAFALALDQARRAMGEQRLALSGETLAALPSPAAGQPANLRSASAGTG